jgi:hypothetical protein
MYVPRIDIPPCRPGEQMIEHRRIDEIGGTTAIGGLWLGLTIFCAVVVNLTVLHANPVPAVVLLLLNALIVYLRRDELASIARAFLLSGACLRHRHR